MTPNAPQPSVLPSSAASPVTASAASTPSRSPAPPTPFTNPTLGYLIDQPAGYRPSSCASWVDGGSDPIGVDFFTPLPEREELELNVGDIPPAERASDFSVSAYRNPDARPAAAWAGGQNVNQGATIEPLTLGGYEAARIVSADAPRAPSFAIRANERIYVFVVDIRRENASSDQFLRAVASTIRAITPGPLPTPPSTPPREGAQQLANLLAKAFRDGDAAGVLVHTRGCTIGMTAVLEPPEPNNSCCILNRSLLGFDEVFRPALTSGALRVVVDPTLHSIGEGSGERFFAVSQWTESGKTRQIDLLFEQRAGQWYWSGAVHHFQRGDGPVCYGQMWGGSYQGTPC